MTPEIARHLMRNHARSLQGITHGADWLLGNAPLAWYDRLLLRLVRRRYGRLLLHTLEMMIDEDRKVVMGVEPE